MVGVWPSEVKGALLTGAKNGDVKAVEAAMASGTKLGHALTEDKRNAMHVAAEFGHRDVLRVLVKAFPGSVNRADAEGRTPLHLACYFGRPREVKYLVEHKAEFLMADVDGNFPLHMAAMCKDGPRAFQVVDLLLKLSPKDLTMHRNKAGILAKEVCKTVDALRAFDNLKLSKRV